MVFPCTSFSQHVASHSFHAQQRLDNPRHRPRYVFLSSSSGPSFLSLLSTVSIFLSSVLSSLPQLNAELASLGTWQSPPGQVRTAVAHALKGGYRHLDCALIYQNETEVGQGIVDSGVPRSEIFITSKVWNTDQPDVAAGLEKTLKSLGTDYLDLYVRGSISRA